MFSNRLVAAGKEGMWQKDRPRIAGATERKASEWLGQRTDLVRRLTKVRNRATRLLAELEGTGASALDSVGRVVRRRLQPVTGEVRRKSGGTAKKVPTTKPKGRARADAQGKQQAARMKASRARSTNAAPGRGKKPSRKG